MTKVDFEVHAKGSFETVSAGAESAALKAAASFLNPVEGDTCWTCRAGRVTRTHWRYDGRKWERGDVDQKACGAYAMSLGFGPLTGEPTEEARREMAADIQARHGRARA